MKVIVSNIQRFSLHDGPGIRTTVFFKGCNLKCPWCSNPENISFEIQGYDNNGIKGLYGKEYSLEELEEIILKDKDYFDKDGGVTFSGGECLMYFEAIEPLLIKLKKNNINICVETSLNVPSKFVDVALKYVDYYYVDLKIINKDEEHLINANCELYISNFKKVYDINKNITIRMPIVPNYTYTEKNINDVINFLSEYRINDMEIFKIHRLGEQKYKSLGLEMPSFEEISDEDINELKKKLEKYVKEVRIIKI